MLADAVVNVMCHCGSAVARGRQLYCSARCAEVAWVEKTTDRVVAANRARIAARQGPCRVCQSPIAGYRWRETCSRKCYRRLFVYRQWKEWPTSQDRLR